MCESLWLPRYQPGRLASLVNEGTYGLPAGLQAATFWPWARLVPVLVRSRERELGDLDSLRALCEQLETRGEAMVYNVAKGHT